MSAFRTALLERMQSIEHQIETYAKTMDRSFGNQDNVYEEAEDGISELMPEYMMCIMVDEVLSDNSR